ncbi:hypothetical protein [Flavisolibacter nicotianae]|uniref:hypothetical protein n=1 Tax=Flavisolibacter nicotianae TaxID=2364882 RepID=UPI000EB4501A|nr:hypothetical protein [Flavisolibacter nicotianae]
MRRILLTVFVISASAIVQAQLKMADLDSFPLGISFKDAKQIKSMFKGEATVLQADFLGAYHIEYARTPFDIYGEADYEFQFVKEKLSSISIEFKFKANQKNEFERLLKQLLSDLKSDRSMVSMKEYNSLNAQNAISYVEKECITNTPEDTPGYKKIKSKHLGTSVWVVTGGINDSRYLSVDCSMYESHYNSGKGNMDNYDGCIAAVTIYFTNTTLQELNSLEAKQKVMNYKTFREQE